MRFPLRATLVDACGLAGCLAFGVLAWRSRAPGGAGLAVLLGTMGLAWAGALAAYAALRRRPGAISLGRVVLWGLAFRLIGLAGEPVLEDDYWRYLWDGRTFAERGTPYGSRPMASFGDPTLAPEWQRVLDGINHPHLPTIYGPTCQYAFLLGHLAAPGRLLPLKILLVVAELAAFALLARRLGRPESLLYLWCPLLVQEVAFNAHVEPLGIAAALAAFAAAGRGRAALAGVMAALAAGARPFGALLAPFALLRGGAWGWTAFAAALAALYAPFALRSGRLEGESLGVFLTSWEFNSSLYAVLSSAFGGAAARAIGAGGFLIFYGATLWTFRRGGSHDLPRGDWILGAFFLASPVLNPWYLLWILPFAAVRPAAWSWTAAAAVTLSYVTERNLAGAGLAGFEHPAWVRPVEFGAVLVAAAAGAWWRRRSAAARARVAGP